MVGEYRPGTDSKTNDLKMEGLRKRAGTQHFLLFSQCFLKISHKITLMLPLLCTNAFKSDQSIFQCLHSLPKIQ